MNDDLRKLMLVASLGLLTGAAIVYSTGHDGSVGGIKIGPSHSLLKVAGR